MLAGWHRQGGAAARLVSSALVLVAMAAPVAAHTTSIGYESAGPGSVTFWYGSYHSGGSFTEGSLMLTGPGTSVTVPFDLVTTTRPGGLIDGVTNFFTDGGSPPGLIGTDPVIAGGVATWQGSTFSGLEAGAYTFTYIPADMPSSFWDPWDAAILSSMVTLDASVLGGDGESDGGVASSQSAAFMATAQNEGLRQIAAANRLARAGQRARASGYRGERTSATREASRTGHGFSTETFSVWASIGGGAVNADFGGNLDTTHFVAQAGLEYELGDFALGLSLGGGRTTARTDITALDGESLFVQPYLTYAAGAFSGVASLAYTRTDYDDSAGAIDSGDRLSGSLGVAYDIELGDGTLLRPFGYAGGGWETLDTSAADDDTSFWTGRAGLELSRETDLGNGQSVTAWISAAAEVISTDAPGTPLLLTDYQDDRFGGRVEAGFDGNISGGVRLFTNIYSSGLFSDAPGYGGRIGIEIPF